MEDQSKKPYDTHPPIAAKRIKLDDADRLHLAAAAAADADASPSPTPSLSAASPTSPAAAPIDSPASDSGSSLASSVQQSSLQPSKFLLGGNIRDPLNLNSLTSEGADQEHACEGDVTATVGGGAYGDAEDDERYQYNNKIQVVIPPNIQDPLNLSATLDDSEFNAQLNCRLVAGLADGDSVDGRRQELPHHQDLRSKLNSKRQLRAAAVAAAAASQALPPSQQSRKQRRRHHRWQQQRCNKSQQENPYLAIHVNPDPPVDVGCCGGSGGGVKYEYGNYDRYYGYRHGRGATTASRNDADGEVAADAAADAMTGLSDERLKYIRPEWIDGKDVLDVGCNTGRLTLAIAVTMAPRSITGIDIDSNLVRIARKSIASARSFIAKRQPQRRHGHTDQDVEVDRQPVINFRCANYVPPVDGVDVDIEADAKTYDVILCLSTTKWMQLNFGDAGLKRAFRRMYAQLRDGGLLILECQPFASYRRRKRLTPRITANFDAIQLRPSEFARYLVEEVGFVEGAPALTPQTDVAGGEAAEDNVTVAWPEHVSRGFQRPLQFFVKAGSCYEDDENDEMVDKDGDDVAQPDVASCGGGSGSTTPLPLPMSYFSTTPQHDSLSAAMVHMRTSAVDSPSHHQQQPQPFYAPSLISPSHSNTPKHTAAAYAGNHSPLESTSTPHQPPSASFSPGLDYAAVDSPFDDGSGCLAGGGGGVGHTPTYATAHPSSLTPGYSGPSPDHVPSCGSGNCGPNQGGGAGSSANGAATSSRRRPHVYSAASMMVVVPVGPPSGGGAIESPTQSNIAVSPNSTSSASSSPGNHSPPIASASSSPSMTSSTRTHLVAGFAAACSASPSQTPTFSPGNATPVLLAGHGDDQPQSRVVAYDSRPESPSTTTTSAPAAAVSPPGHLVVQRSSG